MDGIEVSACPGAGESDTAESIASSEINHRANRIRKPETTDVRKRKRDYIMSSYTTKSQLQASLAG